MPEAAAARLAGVSRRRLRYWEETYLVPPHVSRKVTARTSVRLYSFGDLVELLVVAQLLTRKFSLQEIRKVVDRLRAQGYSHPLRELRFAVAEGEIVFQHTDGEWEGARQPDQIIMEHVLRLDLIGSHVREHARQGREAGDAGKVERRRGTHGSQPVFAGTRVPVAAVAAYLERGRSTKEILTAFPTLTEADVDAARTG